MWLVPWLLIIVSFYLHSNFMQRKQVNTKRTCCATGGNFSFFAFTSDASDSFQLLIFPLRAKTGALTRNIQAGSRERQSYWYNKQRFLAPVSSQISNIDSTSWEWITYCLIEPRDQLDQTAYQRELHIQTASSVRLLQRKGWRSKRQLFRLAMASNLFLQP